MLKDNGYNVKVINLLEMGQSDCYNPFSYIREETDVVKQRIRWHKIQFLEPSHSVFIQRHRAIKRFQCHAAGIEGNRSVCFQVYK